MRPRQAKWRVRKPNEGHHDHRRCTEGALPHCCLRHHPQALNALAIASQLEPNEWYLRIEGELMADSILNRIATGARYVDLDGPNMREYFARRRDGA